MHRHLVEKTPRKKDCKTSIESTNTIKENKEISVTNKEKSSTNKIIIFTSLVQYQVLLTPAIIFKKSGEKTNS